MNLRTGNLGWFVWASEPHFEAPSTLSMEMDSPVMLIVRNGSHELRVREIFGANPLRVQDVGHWDPRTNSLAMIDLGIWERRSLTGIHYRVTAIKVSVICTEGWNRGSGISSHDTSFQVQK